VIAKVRSYSLRLTFHFHVKILPKRAVAKLLETLRCDLKVVGSVPHRVIDLIFNSSYDPGVDLASNTDEYQGYLLRVKAAGA
jgi:hypothetical protein